MDASSSPTPDYWTKHLAAVARSVFTVEQDALPLSGNPLVAAYKLMEAANENKPLTMDVTWGSDDHKLRLELGRRQLLYLTRAVGQPGGSVHQITIRDVELPEAMRGRGYLRELVAYLLSRPGVNAVHLECVENRRLAESCARDPTWVMQGRNGWRPGMSEKQTAMYRPSFATFRPVATAPTAV